MITKEWLITSIQNILKKHFLKVIVFFIFPYLLLMPLFKYETWCAGHDSDGTIFNAWTMVRMLKEWPHFPITWQVDNCGYKGNPYWSFYQPLSNLMVLLGYFLIYFFQGDNIFSAMKVAVYLSYFISAFGMYLLLKNIFSSEPQKELISIFGSVIYLFAPYRFIDLYSRNAYSELWLFPWLPFYLLGFYKLFFAKEPKGWIYIAFSTPCLITSHLMPSFFFIIIIHLAYVIFLLLKKKIMNFIKEDKKIILYWLISNVAGWLISLIYIVPAMNVVKFINGDFMGFDRVSLDNVLNHISWCFDMLDLFNFKGPWQVGQLYLVSFVILNFYLFFRKKTKFFDLLFFLNIATILTFIFLMNKTLWEHLPSVFYNLQFSWRLFVVYSLLASVFVSILALEFNLKIPVLLFLIAFHFYTGERFLHYGGHDVVGKYFNVESWVNVLYRKHYTTTNNYSPRSILPKTSDPVLFNFVHADEVGANEKYSNTFLLNLKPGINILFYERKGNIFNYELTLDSPAFLIFKQYFYPSWNLFIDSKKSKTYLTEQGYIGFEVPEGKHLVRLKSA